MEHFTSLTRRSRHLTMFHVDNFDSALQKGAG